MADLKELEAALIAADKAGDTEAAAVLARDMARIMESSAPTPTAERVVTGVADPFFGAAQLITQGGAKVGIPGFGGVTGLARSVDDYIREREAAYRAPDGVDFARLAGRVVSPVNALVNPAFRGAVSAVSRVAPAASAGVKAAAGGAAAGAVEGAVEPVTSGEFGQGKASQIAAGTALGALGGPGAEKVAQVAADVAKSAARMANPPDPTELAAEVTVRLEGQGIDFKGLSEETQGYILDQVERATRRGGDVDDEFAANLATLREAGIENPTRAQITQNPTEFGSELVLRSKEAGEELASQYQNALATLNDRLAQMAGRMPNPLDDPAAGARLMESLQTAARRGDTYEDALYSIAREQIGRDAPIAGADRFADTSIRSLDYDNALESLPGSIRRRLESMRDGETPLTVDTAENLKNALNRERKRPDQDGAGPVNYALDVVRRELESALDEATGAASIRGIEYFRTARAASRDRRLLEEAIPALEDVRYKGSETAPDDFMRKFVTGPQAKVADLTGLRDFLLRADPQAWQQIRGQVLHNLRQKATKGESGKFLAATFSNEMEKLAKTGKLSVLFTAQERRMLENIGKAGKLLEGPQGVPRTGLLGGARSAEMLGRVINSLGRLVPGIGQHMAEPVAAAVRSAPSKAAARKASEPNIAKTLAGDQP